MRVVRLVLVLVGLCVVAFVAIGLAYANVRSDNTNTAVATAHRFLDAACDKAQRHGWDQLDASQRRGVFGDRDAYIAVAEASDCTAFLVDRLQGYCDDGACTVWFRVADAAAVPAFLLDSGIVQLRSDHVPPGTNAGMGVIQRGPFGQGVSVPGP